ncbi:hypothetical protein EYZ11_013375 [Aspergillus tanneri]|uniref:Uncharacterized protein n=1 Tax=Aspergillus tanneri TaxID=1220188 RepID=A0A4S3J008_9EURO|nr:hypothetical protein EYZ11_013375 [Aspergillus tanneri]
MFLSGIFSSPLRRLDVPELVPDSSQVLQEEIMAPQDLTNGLSQHAVFEGQYGLLFPPIA